MGKLLLKSRRNRTGTVVDLGDFLAQSVDREAILLVIGALLDQAAGLLLLLAPGATVAACTITAAVERRENASAWPALPVAP